MLPNRFLPYRASVLAESRSNVGAVCEPAPRVRLIIVPLVIILRRRDFIFTLTERYANGLLRAFRLYEYMDEPKLYRPTN